MKKIYFTLFVFFLSATAWADQCLEPLLNRVAFQLRAEQWVTTKTALVNVGINAAVSDQGIEKIQNEAMAKLNELSDKTEWHIISFNRQLDKTGLESIQIIAQARLPQTELSNLRDKAKSISKPGETLTVDNVQFIPSEEEIRQANSNLRNNLYQQAKAELEALNKAYPEQKYYLHQIDFTMSMPPMPMAANGMMMAKMAERPAGPLAVGNKQEMQANVTFAALPEVVAQKMNHN